MPMYARCSRCGKRIIPGTICECKKIADRQGYALYDRHQRDRRSDAFYHSAEWKQIRDYVLERDSGIDQYLYHTKGIVEAADTVHHIVPLKESWKRRCDPDNLISLSAQSHNEIEAAYQSDKHSMQSKLFEIVKGKQGGAV